MKQEEKNQPQILFSNCNKKEIKEYKTEISGEQYELTLVIRLFWPVGVSNYWMISNENDGDLKETQQYMCE